VAYRPLSRVTARIMGKMKKSKKEKEVGDAESSDSGSYAGRGKSPVERVSVRGDAEKGVM
jgi:Ca2+-transporting ATPase